MSGFNGSGQFNFTYNWVNDANNNIPITASRMDTQFNDAANGFDLCLTRDGQGSASANLPMNTFKFTGLGNGTQPTDSATFGQLTTATGALTGFIGGLTLSAAGSTGTFGITSGAASDSTSALLLSLTSAFTKTTASFAAGTGNGALDAGSIAINTWYHVYIIGSPALTSDILFSTSPTSPALPVGYTLFRRVGSMLTDASSHWIRFIQRGNEFLWYAPPTSATYALTTAVANYVIAVPTGIEVNAIFVTQFFASGGIVAVGDQAVLSSPDQDTSGVSGIFTAFQVANTRISGGYVNIRTNTAAQVAAAYSSTGAVLNATFYIQGWIDLRGSQ